MFPARNKRLAVALCCALVALPASAERADRDKPVNLEADRVNVDDVRQVSVFEGHVVLTQGTLVIHADKLVVRQDDAGFQYATAYGVPAHFRQKRENSEEYVEGEGARIEYDGKANKVEFFTRARMKRGSDELRGDFISYDATTEYYRVIGGGREAATGNNPQGRVRAMIIPKPKAAPPANPSPLPLKPTENIANPREE